MIRFYQCWHFSVNSNDSVYIVIELAMSKHHSSVWVSDIQYHVWKFIEMPHTKIMLKAMSKQLGNLKRSFVKSYKGRAHIQEILPLEWYDRCQDVVMLHRFAQANPIYYRNYEETIHHTRCAVYEGDINNYWINSIKNPGSSQPFYPTWLLSAYILALAARESGCRQIIDVGSGDGRIAYCGRILGMDVCSVEIDTSLAELQTAISSDTGVDMDIRCSDATEFEYDSLRYDRPAVFTGGLPQLGDLLATSVIQNMIHYDKAWFILAGSRPRPDLNNIEEMFGWGKVIQKFGLKVDWTLELPTTWTFDQKLDTPYMCMTSQDMASNS